VSASRRTPLVSVALPVYNGADTLVPVVEAVLAQSHQHLELVISDNASTDQTQELGRQFERDDPRVVYLRQPRNVGLLNNFISAANSCTGKYVRWIGDDDSIEPDYVARVVEVFAGDPRLVMVTTQMVYEDARGSRTPHSGYDPVALGSLDPVERFGEMLRLLTADFASLDPLYGTMRRELATMPRRNMLREDQVFAARMSLAGPWGHVPAPLATRRRHEGTAASLAGLLGVPAWHRHVRVLLQCRELDHWVAQAGLDPQQRAQAQAEIVRFYTRSKRIKLQRGAARLERLAGRPTRLAHSGVR
jgi:glycosyl transferase family 2